MRRALACVPLLAAGCGTGQTFDPPTPPDMTELVESYEQPSGTLTPQTALEVAQGLVVTAKDLQSAALLVKSVSSGAESLNQAKEEGTAETSEGGLATAEQALSTSIDFWARATWICTGWEGDDAPVDEKWGKVVLTAVGDRDGLDDVIWGALKSCRLLQDDGGQQDIDGDVRVYYPDQSAGRDLLIAFSGTWLGAAGAPTDLDIDFRVVGDALITLQEASNGSFLVQVPFDGLEGLSAGGALQIRDASDTWSCTVKTDLEGGTCTHDGETVTWGE